MSVSFQKCCCDPLKRHTKVQKKDLRHIPQTILHQHPSLGLSSHQYICSACRKEINALTKLVVLPTSAEYMDTAATPAAGDSSNTEDQEAPYSSESMESCDSSDNSASTSLSQKQKAHSSEQTGIRVEGEAQQVALSVGDAEEIVQQLKEKLQSTTSRSERLRVLTVLPKSWSIKKIANVFGVSRYLARKAKTLVTEKGVLSSPNPKGHRLLPVDTEEAVKDFYLSDNISRVMPGKKDFLSVVGADGKREHKQKRLVLCNLREAYREFKECNPDKKIGFTKFSQLRPKECVLAGASGTHSVCVCTVHQNVKLMMAGSGLEALSGGQLKHYRHCLALMQCNPPNLDCYLGSCSVCPGTDPLKSLLENLMDQNGIDTVQFQQWTTTDRATLETRVVPADEFIDTFVSKLRKLLHHDFTAKMQAAFMQQKKESLQEGEVLVIADFSENFSFVVQDEIQSFHWNNESATIHTFICYYKLNTTTTSLCYLVISENKQHDTIAVHLFQRKLVDFLTQHFGGNKPRKIYYMSDGCAAQYKNCKNFTNLCHHYTDFGVEAEWHFFATSHGKSAGDGAGGTLKRTATKASLQRPYEGQILTARQLYDFAVAHIKGIQFGYATLEEHVQEAELLKERLKMSKTVPGTQKLHSVVPVGENIVEVRQFSNSPYSRRERVTLAHSVLSIAVEAINGYVTVAYDGSCWLGCVLKVDEEGRTINITFLHPCIPAKSFVYPKHEDILDMDPSDILTRVNPTTVTGRNYTLSKKEMDEASHILKTRCV